jgi:integrase
LTLRGKTGWREVEVGRGSSDTTCPVAAIETWITFGHLVKAAALAAGVRGDLSESERGEKFSGHSLRAGLASSVEVDERCVQKQLGHASAEMTRRYQRRRDRSRVNLTKASGL